MDLDTTIKGFTLTHENIREIFDDICTIKIDDDVDFQIVSVNDIREKDDYPGIRVSLKANYEPISVPLTVDVTTGDVITPKEIEYTFSLMFDERSINIISYNLETILAEKIETVLSRAEANTRPRDFYDIYILWNLHKEKCDIELLKLALKNTAQKRESTNVISKHESIISSIENSTQLQFFWNKYKKEFDYAKEIEFSNICKTILEIMRNLM